ncbi:helix-turn-helix transcriptional regulator [Brevibacillus choshinensis]|uniref:helix-turn-helix transcriptional regulator n=1 Tax=Brevibacillus choshinensis TaxID=54911 RepID=UPI002E22F580|nr:helix-turn-helix transcriptional regulator [Brevibacillus choshinensis]
MQKLDQLIDARLELGLTQEQLAIKAGLSRAMLSNIERGYTLPSLRVAHRIALVLNYSIEYLFFNKNAHKMNVKTKQKPA